MTHTENHPFSNREDCLAPLHDDRLDGAAACQASADSIQALSQQRNFTEPDRSERPAQMVVGPSKELEKRDESSLERELSLRETRLAELERVCKNAVRERELATVLAGKPLVPGAAAQLIKLWRDEFDAYEENGVFKVTGRDGRPVSQIVNEWLGAPEYSHFSLAKSRGGTGASASSKPIDALANPTGPKNLGEAIVMKWREESVSKPENFLKPIGLRRGR